MKYLKTFEEKNKRKFKPGDIVKYKFSQSQPFEILDWVKSLNSYRVKDLHNNYNTYFRSNQIEIYPPDKLDEWYMKQNAEKYNL